MSVVNGFVTECFFDGHIHLRKGWLLEHVIDATADACDAGIVMPNPEPPILTPADAISYRNEIVQRRPDFTPGMTMYLTAKTTPDMVFEAKRAGVLAIKYYPVKRSGEAGTTNAGHGLTPEQLVDADRLAVLKAMEEADLVFCAHAEDPDADWLEREVAFLPYLFLIARLFPKLRIVFEHVSDRRSFPLIEQFPNVYAGVAIPHLTLTLNDVIGCAWHHCLPIPKTRDDRKALLEAVFTGPEGKYFYGTDTAPHTEANKANANPRFGIFSAPVAPAIAADLWSGYGRISRFLNFTSRIGRDVYRLPEASREIEIVREDWTVPDPTAERGHDPATTVRSFMAGRTLPFRVRPLSP